MATPPGNNLDASENGGGRILSLLRPYTLRLFTILILLILLAGTSLALPVAMKVLIDDVFKRPDRTAEYSQWTLLFLILGGLVAIYATRNFLFYTSRMQALRVSEDLCFSLRKRLFEHLQQMNMKFYHSNEPGRVGARVMDDTFKIQSFIQEKLPIFMLNLVKFQILVVVLCVVNLPLALTSMVVLPLQFMTYRYFRMSIKKSHSEAQENLASAYANIVEKFLGMEVVKGFSAESRESDTFNRAIDASRKSQIRSQRYHFAQKVTADLIVGLGTVLLLGYGAYEVIRMRMSSGTFLMFFGFVGMLYPAVLELISGAGHLSKATASIDRIYEMLDVPLSDEGVIGKGATRFAVREGAIEFKNVSFAFENSEPLLRDVSFKVKPGEHVAITGPSGSGKSTMLSLLPRLQTIRSGQILIDGQDISKIPLLALRAGMATAFQEVFLFHTSVIENLRYANPKADNKKIMEACQITGADEVIERMPSGFNTRIGTYGGELSRGEKQRITLARALLKNAPILILDEATASIDSASARILIERIVERLPATTIIMVTHDTNLLSLAERTMVMQEGRIVFDGPSTEFLENLAPEYITPISPGFINEVDPKSKKEDDADGLLIENKGDQDTPHTTPIIDREEAKIAMESWEDVTRYRKQKPE